MSLWFAIIFAVIVVIGLVVLLLLSMNTGSSTTNAKSSFGQQHQTSKAYDCVMSEVQAHIHTAMVDPMGNGTSSFDAGHTHEVRDFKVMPAANGHSHEIACEPLSS